MKKIATIIFTTILLLCAQQNCQAIKIGLQVDVNSIVAGISTDGKIIDANTNTTVCDLDKMTAYEIRPYNSVLAIKIEDRYYKINSDNIVIRFNEGENGYTSIKNKWYRGLVHIQNKNGHITVINDVPLEDYLKGVVPAEMPSGWNEEALKAQAIAARSYAMANLGKRANLGFDLYDTPEDQAYGGASAETEKTNHAVTETKDIVLIHNMKIICAYYFASAGGHSFSADDVWGSNLPYIHSVPSYDDSVRKSGHGVGMSQHGANNLAGQGYNAYQILQHFYNDIKFARLKDS